jgi:hypothetical protein
MVYQVQEEIPLMSGETRSWVCELNQGEDRCQTGKEYWGLPFELARDSEFKHRASAFSYSPENSHNKAAP